MRGWNKPKKKPRITPADLRKVVGLSIALIALTAVVFAQMWHAAFINYGDPERVLQNAAVGRGLSRAGAIWAFTTDVGGNWFPVTWVSHMLDVRLFGPSASGHHLTSVLLHAGSALLLFAALRRGTGAIAASAFAAFLFAFHPLQVEPVAWIAQRQAVLGPFFGMLTLYAYVRYAQDRAWPWYVLVVASYALALMANPSLIALPVCLLLFDVWPLGRNRPDAKTSDAAVDSDATGGTASVPDLVWEKLPLFAFAVAVSVVVFAAKRSAPTPFEPLSAPSYVANVVISLAAYVGNWVWPRNLAVYYGFAGSVVMLKVVASLVVLSAISVAVFWQRRARPYLIVGWLWYLATLLPALMLVRSGLDVMGDRFVYVPLIGLSIALAWLARESVLEWHAPRRFVAVAAGLLIIACAAQSRHLVGYWQSGVPLWERARSASGSSRLVEASLGQAYAAEGNAETAATHYAEAVRLGLNDPAVVAGLATQLVRQGKTDEAIAYYLKAIEIMPDPIVHYRVAQLLRGQGRLSEADEHLRAALQLRPDFMAARMALEASDKNPQSSESAPSAIRQQ